MFSEVKSMLPVMGDDYDAEIILQIKAAALDLTRTADIVLPGSIDIKRELEEVSNPFYDPNDPENDEPERVLSWVIHDNSTVTDELIIVTIATWCTARIGNPPNYDKLLAAYEMYKGNLCRSSEYTNYPEDEAEPEDEDEPEAGADEEPAETDPPAGE